MSTAWFDRFTDRARKVMGLARQASDRLKHGDIRTEHILLGLIEEGSGVAANILEDLDVDLDKLRAEIEKAAGRGDKEDVDPKPFMRGARKVLDCAVEEARGMGHKYVGTEHILLGLLRVEDSKSAQMLARFEVKLDDVRRDVKKLLGADPVIDKFTVPSSGKPSLADMMQHVGLWRAEAEASGDVTLAARLRYLLDYLRQRMEGRERPE